MSTATEMRDKYIAAESALLEGKVAKIGDRLLQMEDLAEIRAGRKEWESRANGETARANKSPRIGGLGYSLARMD